MRSAAEIKRLLCKLRFQKGIPLKRIAEDSRCSVDQVKDGMRMEATETVQRRLDAYLDCGDLHRLDKETPLLARMMRMNLELWRVYGAHSMKYEDMMLLPLKQQLRLASAMNHRLKKLLREKIEKEYAYTPYLADGKDYWRCKAEVYREAKERAVRRNDGVRPRQAPKTALQ